jgi:deazaflavin-dependent oxidoreductase (nitroreductase family)
MTLDIPPSGTHGSTIHGKSMMRAGNSVYAGLYRLLGGKVVGGKTLILTTTGARSGQERTAMIARFPDGSGRWLVVASNSAAAQQPAWLINLAKNPDKVWAQVGSERSKVTPDILKGDERAEAWKRIVAASPNFGKYQTKTDREIPVVRLTVEPAAGQPSEPST